MVKRGSDQWILYESLELKPSVNQSSVDQSAEDDEDGESEEESE